MILTSITFFGWDMPAPFTYIPVTRGPPVLRLTQSRAPYLSHIQSPNTDLQRAANSFPSHTPKGAASVIVAVSYTFLIV